MNPSSENNLCSSLMVVVTSVQVPQNNSFSLAILKTPGGRMRKAEMLFLTSD
jgi:hypothetical protein